MSYATRALPSILVVDDNPAVHGLLELMLRPLQVPLYLVNSGQEALATLHRCPAGLIILDLMMPGAYDGMAVIHALSQSPQLRTIPVIIFTTYTSHIDEQNTAWPAQVVSVVDKARMRPHAFRMLVQTILTPN